ncbi:MAG: 2'-5' RNA ligase family protein [Bacteroidetes bacterium]|nr:2'-5' RNA ligase family protein [Bacteroidota bacterium]
MTSNIRRQLTLFVEPTDAITIEQTRQKFNSRQFEIIKAHVTLCREDEIENLDQVISNLFLLTQTQQNIFIKFGKVARFDNGKGLFLPATNDNKDFENLRSQVLLGLYDNPRNQEPHITLMHPRNSTCTDDIFRQIEKLNLPTKLEFKRISLIEQENGGQWKTLKDFEFKY